MERKFGWSCAICPRNVLDHVGKADQQDLNDKETVLELIEVQQAQENSLFSAEEISEDEVDIGETEYNEDHPDTIFKTKNWNNALYFNFQQKIISA